MYCRDHTVTDIRSVTLIAPSIYFLPSSALYAILSTQHFTIHHFDAGQAEADVEKLSFLCVNQSRVSLEAVFPVQVVAKCHWNQLSQSFAWQ
jgi:hypothetical protein